MVILFVAALMLLSAIFPCPACAEELTEAPENLTIITFGTYEQDNDYSSGPEAIEWIILEDEEDSALLISRYAIDCKQVYPEQMAINWADTTIRYWLNGMFYSMAFSAEEQEKIILSTIDPWTSGECRDKVYFLSLDEAYRYWDLIRDFEFTEFARARAVSQGEATENDGEEFWWLRSDGAQPGGARDRKACVTGSVIEYFGRSVEHANGGVRPVIRIKK